jgi:hypothetical protein
MAGAGRYRRLHYHHSHCALDRARVAYKCFQVTLLQVADLQWVATGAVLALIASNSGLSLAPSSRPACGVLTIDTTARPPELGDALVVGAAADRLAQVAGKSRPCWQLLTQCTHIASTAQCPAFGEAIFMRQRAKGRIRSPDSDPGASTASRKSGPQNLGQSVSIRGSTLGSGSAALGPLAALPRRRSGSVVSSHLLGFPAPPGCAFASWRLCVNGRLLD